MEDDSDFTFCQVGPPVDGVEEKNLVSDVSGITIKDEYSNGMSSSHMDGNFGKIMMFPNCASSKREGTIGSLSFSVTETSSTQQFGELSRQTASSNALTLSNNFLEKKPAARKPASRAKVPFEKGYSQMDWLKLTQTHPDLAGLKGQSNRRLISMAEVKQHQTECSMWTVLKGRVYNLYPYMKFHPGGVDMLMKAVGKDCTSLFNKYHAWVNAEVLLEKCLVGTLDDTR